MNLCMYFGYLICNFCFHFDLSIRDIVTNEQLWSNQAELVSRKLLSPKKTSASILFYRFCSSFPAPLRTPSARMQRIAERTTLTPENLNRSSAANTEPAERSFRPASANWRKVKNEKWRDRTAPNDKIRWTSELSSNKFL